MNKDEILKYWIDSSDNDFSAMRHLFEKGDYSWSLFIGHLVIEKLLKGYYVKQIDVTPPFTHDLIRISEKSGLQLTENQKDILDTISAFNLQTRYDDYKMSFQQKCTQPFTEEWIGHITEIRQWLKNKLLKP